MRVTIALRKLDKKHDQVRATLKNEQANSRARENQIRGLQEIIKGKDTGEKNLQRALIEQLQKEVASLKGKVNITASHHVQTAELAQEEKEKDELANTLAKEREDKEKMAETIATL